MENKQMHMFSELSPLVKLRPFKKFGRNIVSTVSRKVLMLGNLKIVSADRR